jgi:uncharacterized protein (TIGR02284 family)
MLMQKTIRTLNQLTRVCRDGEESCRICSRRTASSDLRALLCQRCDEWGRLGDELQALVLSLGGSPVTSGTVAARARRAWLVLSTALVGPTDAALIEAWRRAQRHALAPYTEAVGGYLPERIRRTVSLQADRIADRLDEIDGLQRRGAVHFQS